MAVTFPVDHGLFPLPKSSRRAAGRLGQIGHRIHHSAWRWVLLFSIISGTLLTVTNAGRALLASQYSARMNNPCYAGPILFGVTAGCHLNQYMALTGQYHPNNEFETGDAIGLGFGEANFVYGQEGIEAYHNLDKHTFVGNMRLYVLGPIYVGLGAAHQRGSSRSVTFAQGNRTIGNSLYEDISVTVETQMKDQTAPVLAVGLHPFLRRIGLIAEANFGLAFSKQLDDANITTSQPLSDEDLALFKEVVRQDAESEGFGIATYGITFSFSPPGLQ